MQDLAFMVDITKHLNNLNKMSQGRKRLVTQYYDTIREFKLNLSLWRHNFPVMTLLFPCLKSVRAKGLNSDLNQYKDKMTDLLQGFKQRFQIFGKLKTDFQVFCSPFTVNPSDLPVDLQLEIIALQCDSDFNTKFALVRLDTFYQYLFPGYPKVTSLATNVLCMLLLGKTYRCEQVSSVMNIIKTKLRSRLTHT